MSNSLAWPNMFDVSRDVVTTYNDMQSITNRVKLLLLTEPTELYMNPNFGVGLKKYLFKYNSDNVIPMIRDELVQQLILWEPGVIPEETEIVRKGSSSDDISSISNKMNNLELTVTLKTTQMKTVSFDIGASDFNI